jgi:hypothetical protein
LPATLSELVPVYIAATPKDPFADKDIKYRVVSGRGVVVYSIGADGVDNGGHIDRANRWSGKAGYDVGFELVDRKR